MAETCTGVKKEIDFCMARTILNQLTDLENIDHKPGFDKKELKAAQKSLSLYFEQRRLPKGDIICYPTWGVTSPSLLVFMADLKKSIEANTHKVKPMQCTVDGGPVNPFPSPIVRF